MYDRDQLNKDLSLIVSVFGERKKKGFFTIGYYYYKKTRICIIDPYTSEPKIYGNRVELDKDKIVANSYYFAWILQKAIEAETYKEYTGNPVYDV